jgi:competence protein ComEC
MFLLGVASGRVLTFNLRLTLYALVIASASAVIFGRRSLGFILLLSVFWLSNFYFLWRGSTDLTFYYDKSVLLRGLIIKDVENNGLEQKVTLKLRELCSKSGQCHNFTERVLLTMPLYPQYEYGQVLELEGKLTWPEGSYAHYLLSQGIFALVYNPKNLQVLASGQGNFFWENLYQVKYFILRRLNLLLPAPHSSFLAALLLGIRQGMPDNVNEDFRRAGISHIVAVSGYNISLLANFSLLLLPYFHLKRKQALVFSIVLIGVFVLLTGASASVVRAGIMGVLLLLGRLFEKPGQIFNVLLLTAALMTFYNPGVLLGDLGFQLSFMATIALIYFLPVLIAYSPFYKEDSWWQENFFTTLSATIATLPLILYHFGLFSVLAIPVNLLVLPFIPYLMFFGFLSFLVSLLWLGGAKIISMILYGLLQAILSVARLASDWRWSVLEIFSYSLFWVFLFYAIFFIIIISFHSRKIKYEKHL